MDFKKIEPEKICDGVVCKIKNIESQKHLSTELEGQYLKHKIM